MRISPHHTPILDRLPVTASHPDAGASVCENVDDKHERVLAIVRGDGDFPPVSLRDCLDVVTDRGLEIHSFATSVRKVPSLPEIGELGDELVTIDLEGLVVDMFGAAPERVHLVNFDNE